MVTKKLTKCNQWLHNVQRLSENELKTTNLLG